MVVGVFPAMKLGVLFIRQISKPLAQMFVNQAKNHPVFRTYFIIPPAQWYHWAEVKARMYLMNLGKPTTVAKLNETMAIELGASLMGEVIIFSVGGGCLLLEYNRQATKEAKKEEARQAELQKFTNDIETLNQTTTQQGVEIQRLEALLEDLAKHTKHKLPTKNTLDKGVTIENSSIVNRTGMTTDVKNEEDALDNGNTNNSLVQQAIRYFQKDVKKDRLS